MSSETNNGMPGRTAMSAAGGGGSSQAASLLLGEGGYWPEEARRCRSGAPWFRQLLVLAALVCLATFLLQVVGDPEVWVTRRAMVLVAVTGIAFWRWSWFIIQNFRAIIYRYYTFPRLRREAQEAIANHGPVPEVTILATTYHEKPWITGPVFHSVMRELSELKGLTRRPKLVVVTGCDQDDANIREIFERFCEGHSEVNVGARLCPEDQPQEPLGRAAAGAPHTAALRGGASDGAGETSVRTLWPPELVLLRGENGKRPALATGMEEIARGNPREDGVVIIIDGDTMFQPGLLQKILPIFRLSPQVDALTTNETGLVKGPAWFAEWTSLRFGLRHRSMCSVSLSGKLLCLTGRFSAFRASVAIDPTFRTQVEHDVIQHWLWGSFEMLSGDDKSTWYWLSAHGKRMLYVPDALVTTFEVVQEHPIKRAMANIKRWSGNSVRHSWRAIRLGPSKLGWFPWWCLLDQRLTTATVLFGPTVAILALCAGHYEMVAGYLLWVMCSRMSHAAIAWRQGRRLSAYYVPLQVVSDWATALTKLWVTFHPAKQSWLNRGARTLNTTKGSAFYSLRSGFAHYLYGFSCFALVAIIGLFVGFLPLLREARLFFGPTLDDSAPQPARQPLQREEHSSPDEPDLPLNRKPTAIAISQPWMAAQVLSKDGTEPPTTISDPVLHEQPNH